MKIERLSHNEIFLEIKRALNPLANDVRPYHPPGESLVYESARSQMANVNIEDHGHRCTVRAYSCGIWLVRVWSSWTVLTKPLPNSNVPSSSIRVCPALASALMM